MNPPATTAITNLYERRTPRLSLSADVTLRRAGQCTYRVTVFDVSPLGCKIEIVERPEVDELVWIKFEGLQPLQANVCWTAGFKAGVAFNSPIHPAVFETLVSRLGR